LNRAFNWLGRQTGRVVGGLMDGAGKIGIFAIEEVAPQVLKEAVQGGVPLNAALVRRVARELLINRVADAVTNHQYRRAARLSDGADAVGPIANDFGDLGIDEDPIIGADFESLPTPTIGEESEIGGSGIIEKRPVRFTNNGFEPVTVIVESYEPAPGLSPEIPAGSTVVSPETNSSASLELPLGTYTFCYYWQLDQDYDNDDYFDYHHRVTTAYSLNENSSKDIQSSVTVTLNPESNISNPNGKCGEVIAENNMNLTPEEQANQGVHTCSLYYHAPDVEWLDGETDTVSVSVAFSNGSAQMGIAGGEQYTLTPAGHNTYTWLDDNGNIQTYIFTMEGFEIQSLVGLAGDYANATTICTRQD
jgi:hypothetical protein